MHKSKQFLKERIGFFLHGAVVIIPLLCALLLLSQTVLAQNTYVITDGSRTLVHTTSATDPGTVLNEAGLKLGADDSYTTQFNNGIPEITVRRGQTAIIQPDTVFANETYTETIAHETTYCRDASLPAGTQRVLTKGNDGQMLCTASVVYEGGKETSRTVLTKTILEPPTTEVIALGTGSVETAAGYVPDVPVIGDGIIITPTGEVLTYTDTMEMVATAYSCDGYLGITATGTHAREGAIAVDPSVIPYGTRMYIVSKDGSYVYGIATAEDCGGGIIGNRIDLYYNTTSECWLFGCRDCIVYILG